MKLASKLIIPKSLYNYCNKYINILKYYSNRWAGCENRNCKILPLYFPQVFVNFEIIFMLLVIYNIYFVKTVPPLNMKIEIKQNPINTRILI